MKKTMLFIMCCCGLMTFGATAQKNAQEWGNYQYYAQENEHLRSATTVPGRVVFIGNSITAGWVNQHPDFFTRNGYIGRGISGQTSYQMLLRFREDVVALAPEVVVINAATNDIAENTGPYVEEYTLGNIASMADLARANGIKVILTTTLPSAHFGWNPAIKDAPAKITALNNRLREYAQEQGIPFVDYYSDMVNPEDEGQQAQYTGDGVHPNSQGYDVMEALITPVIESLLHSN
ncbi:lipase [Barnesiella viscericola DSM 18177]|uniref:Lipase n=2 Tax=Barnesiella viscericola TaxID=397865 RepID=W0EQU7_9BACT|nr:SGNH/GDSL hydrolase family protein [Barnesiella viscericola]AHF11918.1 lipase [Barnesiella viscericola DSM 18177]